MTDFFDLPQPELTPGKVIRAFRRNFKLTLEDMELVTGIASTNLSAIENDSRRLGEDVAVRLAAVFGINPALILFPLGAETLNRPDLKEIHERAEQLLQKKFG